MADRLSALHAELGDLRRAVAALESRLTALEQSASLPAAEPAMELAPDADRETLPGRGAGAVLALTGRAFLAFGGAFVLRALTESAVVGPTTGVWLGVTYAVAWAIAAERSAGPSRLLNGWLSLAIGLPLVLEAAGRFKLLSPGTGVMALALVAGVALGLAWHRRLPSLAAGAAGGGAFVALALGLGTAQLLPYAALSVTAGVGTLWIAYDRDWRWLAWLSAAAVDLTALLAALRACVRPPLDPPLGAEAILAVFGALYVGSFVLRTLFHERTVRAFEVTQTAAVMVIGFGGAILVARVNGLGLLSVGLPAAIAGVALYAQTFVRVAARRGYGGDFHYYALTAFALTLAGTTILLPAPALPYVTAAGALALAALAARLRERPLLLQAAIAIIVAAIESGVFRLLAATWVGHVNAWPSFGIAPGVVLAAAAACYVSPPVGRLTRDSLTSAARLLLGGCLACGLACGALLAVGPFIAGRPADPGVLATMRTVVLTAAVLLLARIGRGQVYRELAWLAYLGLAAGALKILVEDVATSRASTLFIALGAYGLALILTPRMMRSPAPDSASAPPPVER